MFQHETGADPDSISVQFLAQAQAWFSADLIARAAFKYHAVSQRGTMIVWLTTTP